MKFRRNGRRGLPGIRNADQQRRYETRRIPGRKSILGRIWSLNKRKFKEDRKRRMKLFDTLVRSVITYGAEIWGYKEWKEIEKIQDKYINWTLKLDRTAKPHNT